MLNESGPGASAPDAVTTMTVPTKSSKFNPLDHLSKSEKTFSGLFELAKIAFS